MSGQDREFEIAVALYERRLYGVALRLTSNADDAAELVQDTFVRAYRAWSKFRKDSQSYTWMYRIMVNLNKDRLAKLARRRENETDLLDDQGNSIEIRDTKPEPDKHTAQGELSEVLAAAIESLPAGYRECVVLKDAEGLSYEEIAGVMDITVEAVRSRLARARQQLRQRLAQYLKM